MNTRQTIAISVLSSLLTLITVSALLFGSGTVVAQQPVPAPVKTADPQPPELPVQGSRDSQSPAVPEAPDAGTVYIHIAGSAFTPLYGDTDTTPVNAAGCIYSAGASSSHAAYNFPVILPPGSIINSVRFYYNDTSALGGSLVFREMDDGNSFSNVSAMVSTGAAGLGYTTVTGLNYALDYVNYSYVLEYYANVTGSTIQLCGVRIGYTPPSIFGAAIPVVLNSH
jgi:hypothetical protein